MKMCYCYYYYVDLLVTAITLFFHFIPVYHLDLRSTLSALQGRVNNKLKKGH